MSRNIGITIGEIIKLNCLGKCKLLTDKAGIHRIISKVNIAAGPDFLEWLDKGAFLLTTAYEFKNNDIDEQKKMIQACIDKKVAGVGIKIYPYMQELPSEVIELAKQFELPILDIYHETPLSDIMTELFKEINNKQFSLLQKTEKVHQQIMKVILNGGAVKDIAKIAYENIQNPMVVKIEYTEQIIMGTEDLAKEMKNSLLENCIQFYNSKNDMEKYNGFYETIEIINDKGMKRIVMPITVRNIVYGHIFAWEVETPLDGFDLSVVERASTTMALEVLKLLSVRDVENRHRIEFMEDLLSLDISRKNKALERVELFKLDNTHQFIMMIIHIEKDKYFMGDLQQKIVHISSDIERLTEELKIRAFITNKTDSIYIMLSFEDGHKYKEPIKLLSKYLQRLLARKFKKEEYRIGIGRSYKGLSEVYKSYKEANKAICHGKLIGESNETYFEQLGIYKILCQGDLGEELEKFYETTLLSLTEYDKKKSTELVNTLEKYFLNNGNLKKISEDLYTHYNTVLYRIQRIEKITGLSLDNHNDRLNLEIALKIKSILENTQSIIN